MLKLVHQFGATFERSSEGILTFATRTLAEAGAQIELE